MNAFFGFQLPLPADKHFQIADLSDSNKALQHFIFAEKSTHKGLTLLIVSATQVLGNAADEAPKAVFLPGQQAAKAAEAVAIGGHLFWKNQSEQKTFSGKVYRFRYATANRGFVVVFSVTSQNAGQSEEFRQDIESIKFFDLAQAKEIAGANAHPYVTDAVRKRLESAPKLDVARLDHGTLSGNLYSNPFLGFSYQFPKGWNAENEPEILPKTKSETTTTNSGDSSGDPKLVEQCTRVLGQATEYPPTSKPEFNPRITILAADPGCFAADLKFPTSVHDNEDIELFGQAIVRAFSGTPLLGRDASRLIAADLAGHIFLEMPSGTAIAVPGSTLLRKIHMWFVLTTLRQYWVIWLMESDTESELTQLMKTSITFSDDSASANVEDKH